MGTAAGRARAAPDGRAYSDTMGGKNDGVGEWRSRWRAAALVFVAVPAACTGPRAPLVRQVGAAETPAIEERSDGAGAAVGGLALALERGAETGLAIVGRSTGDRPVEAIVLGSGPVTVLAIAGLHGDRAVGTRLTERWADELLAAPLRLAGRRVVMVPAANPDGQVSGERGAVGGVDIAADFPAAGRPGTPEGRALADLVETVRPSRIVLLHGTERRVSFNGPAAERADRVATAAGRRALPARAAPPTLEAWLDTGGGGPEVLRIGLPAGERRLDDDELWRRYGAALTAVLDG